MFRPWRCKPPLSAIFHCQRRTVADLGPFREGDLVLLRQKDDRSTPPVLSRPLKPGRRIESHKGVVRHDDILGKRVRDVVTTLPKRQRDTDATPGKEKERQEYRLYEVKLDEYVRFTKRLVTPIYPADARLIVDLLDLHPLDHRSADSKLEILEAGTGHGALTLYLARAISPLNATLVDTLDGEDRRAIVHTIDISEKYSQHARGVVEGFRNGLYHRNVDFHVGDVADWTAAALENGGGKPFLSHAFLDLPNADDQVKIVAEALRVDGSLIIFNPSITQIMDVAKRIKDDSVPLELERVLELGVNGGSGGREWDVRPVKPRAARKADSQQKNGELGEESGVETERDDEQIAMEQAKTVATTGWSMVCRPKVGERVVGGGFLGVWKKQRRDDAP